MVEFLLKCDYEENDSEVVLTHSTLTGHLAPRPEGEVHVCENRYILAGGFGREDWNSGSTRPF
jgi:hypothetical protein